MRTLAAAAAGLLVAACGGAEARDQWLVTVSTDAPIPLLGDRLLVEILDEEGAVACSECRRHFDASSPEALPLSFGAVADASFRSVRARLHRSAVVGADGLPTGAVLLDALARLPSAAGVEELAFELLADCFGVPADPVAGVTCDPATRALTAAPQLEPALGGRDPLKSGSWPPAARVPCRDAPPPGMVCVEGGVFLLGTPRPLGIREFEERPERLVQLSAFVIDEREVTVRQVREHAGDLSRTPGTPVSEPRCTYTATEGDPALPVNCTSRDIAAEVCAARGLRLPREAEWEYVASNGAAKTAYPWGDDPDVCAHARVGRGSAAGVALGESIACYEPGVPSGPTAEGGPADVTFLGVRDLAGNVNEWVADDQARYDDPCWLPEAFPLIDPQCRVDPPSPFTVGAVRGGEWTSVDSDTLATFRTGQTAGDLFVKTGFRCAGSW
jgi:formylglycine-generating enzyme